MEPFPILFFASKLLPIFLYPLGLACSLMMAVWIGGARRRWQSVLLCVALAVLWLAGSRAVGMTLTHLLEWRYLPTAELPSVDAIVVLGGVTQPRVFPRPEVDVKEAADRLFYAARLFHEGKSPTIVVSAGNAPWSASVEPEASDMAAVLNVLGVPEEAIIEEGQSRNTYENAVETRKILAARGMGRVILVTSAVHMPRAAGLFRHQQIDVIPAPTDFVTTAANPYGFGDGSAEAVVLALLPDADGLSFTTRAMKEYLGLAIYRLQGLLD